MTAHIGRGAGRALYAAQQSLRAAWYGGNYALARRLSGGPTRPGEAPFRPSRGFHLPALREAFFDVFRQDIENIQNGLYPAPPLGGLKELRRMADSARQFWSDFEAVDRRRRERDGVSVRELEAADPGIYPPYYRQNFHYQSGGWFTEDSAERYDAQVETLFTGAAGPMRRLALAELATALEGRDQRGLKAADVACGTGAFTAEVARSYPRLPLSAVDLSPAYIRKAGAALSLYPRAGAVQANAEALPFADRSLDAVWSVYLFHELPARVRVAVLAEVGRVLRPGGVFVLADSLQFGDNPKLDGLLEFFPETFHEPYYKEYLGYDLDAAAAGAGLQRTGGRQGFLTKAARYRKG